MLLVTYRHCRTETRGLFMSYLRDQFVIIIFIFITSNHVISFNLFLDILVNPLSASFTKWSNTLKQFVGKLPANCLSMFDHFVGLALKTLTSVASQEELRKSDAHLEPCKRSITTK